MEVVNHIEKYSKPDAKPLKNEKHFPVETTIDTWNASDDQELSEWQELHGDSPLSSKSSNGSLRKSKHRNKDHHRNYDSPKKGNYEVDSPRKTKRSHRSSSRGSPRRHRSNHDSPRRSSHDSRFHDYDSPKKSHDYDSRSPDRSSVRNSPHRRRTSSERIKRESEVLERFDWVNGWSREVDDQMETQKELTGALTQRIADLEKKSETERTEFLALISELRDKNKQLQEEIIQKDAIISKVQSKITQLDSAITELDEERISEDSFFILKKFVTVLDERVNQCTSDIPKLGRQLAAVMAHVNMVQLAASAENNVPK